MIPSLLYTVLLLHFAIETLASASLRARNDSSIPSGINVTIINNASLDITGSFQTMVWFQPTYVALTELTGRAGGLSRLIQTCKSPTGIFRYSHCNHMKDIPNSMQSYLVYCREPSPPRGGNAAASSREGRPTAEPTEHAEPSREGRPAARPTGRRTRARPISSSVPRDPPTIPDEPPGSCNADEICVNGLSRRTGFGAVARCVKKSAFKDLLGDSGADAVDLGNRMATLVLSKEDGSTPLGSSSLGAAWALSGPVATNDRRQPLGEKKECVDCVDLSVGKSPAKVEGLEVEAAVVTAGMMAGVVWLAVLSG